MLIGSKFVDFLISDSSSKANVLQRLDKSRLNSTIYSFLGATNGNIMPVNTIPWRVKIGSFRESKKSQKLLNNLCWLVTLFFASLFLTNKLLEHGDIEINPGPRPKNAQLFSLYYWNLNSIVVYNLSKVPLLMVYNYS